MRQDAAATKPKESPVSSGRETVRSRERRQEDQQFASVIVKRNDETRRHPDDVLESAVVEGLEQFKRSTASLFLSAIVAGLILGFSAMGGAVVYTLLHPGLDSSIVRLAVAIVYPLGFVVCMMSGTELFTEHTATAAYPVLDGRASLAGLSRVWTVVLSGNLVGAFATAGLLRWAEPVIGARDGYIALGRHLVEVSGGSMVASAILAGWLMALGAWLILATPPTVAQLLSIYIVTFLIGLGNLHHSIAGSVEVFAAMLNGSGYSAAVIIRFLTLTVAGNLVGGAVFVAVLNYGHIRSSRID